MFGKKVVKMAMACLVCLMFTPLAFAQYLLIEEEPRIPEHPDARFAPLYLKNLSVNTEITEQVATTTMDLLLSNPNPQHPPICRCPTPHFFRPVEGKFLLPTPLRATVKEFKMTIGDKEYKAELLPAPEAKRIYEEIVYRRKDPALLEYLGYQLIQARIFPINPGADIPIKISYSYVLPAENWTVDFSLPMGKHFVTAHQQGIQNVSLTINIRSKIAIKSIISPTHTIYIERKDDNNVKVSFQATNYTLPCDFRLYYTLSDKDVSWNIITYKESTEDGFFMLMCAPKYQISTEVVIPKDIIMVLDRSGSMSGDKIRQAKDALKFCLERLNEDDRFNIIDFATDVRNFKNNLVDFNKDTLQEALSYVNGIGAGGGTNINDALLTALNMLSAEQNRMPVILFLTDGLPTVGQTSIAAILRNVSEANKVNSRMYVFGVGLDVNTRFLDLLATNNRGSRSYVQPEENIEEKVASLYNKISSPVYKDIKITASNIRLYDIYPHPIPSLFKGEQILIFGRYSGTGSDKIEISCQSAKGEEKIQLEYNFPQKDVSCDFIPFNWASMKIGHLLDQIVLTGREDKEVIDEIVNLARRYGIVTPYTSFLIVEEGMNLPRAREFLERELRFAKDRAAQSGMPEMAPDATKQAQKESEKRQALKESTQGRSQAEIIYGSQVAAEDAKKAGARVIPIQQLGAKTFYQKGSTWIDSQYDPEKQSKLVKEIKFGSEEYKKLLEQYPELAKYLHIGQDIIITYEAQVFHIK